MPSSPPTVSALSEGNIPISYGTDWTDRAYPTAHCWFPYTPADPTSSPPCSFFSCKNPKPPILLALVQCESCFLIVHTHHLSNLSAVRNSSMPACRPSFHDEDEQDRSDRHFWSPITALSKPCAFCKRKSMSNPIFSGANRPSTMPTLDIMTKGVSYSKSPLPDSPKPLTTAGGLQCLWCTRGYHRRCWEQVFTHEDRNRCDYGIFRYTNTSGSNLYFYHFVFFLDTSLFDHSGFVVYQAVLHFFAHNIQQIMIMKRSIHLYCFSLTNVPVDRAEKKSIVNCYVCSIPVKYFYWKTIRPLLMP